jgi:hypothetical protein
MHSSNDVDSFTNIRMEDKKRPYPLPMMHPGFTNRRILPVLSFCKIHEGLLCLHFGFGRVDGPEVRCDSFTVLAKTGHHVCDSHIKWVLFGILSITVRHPYFFRTTAKSNVLF